MPAWAALSVLLLLLGFALFRNFQQDRRPRAQNSSDLIELERSAVSATKTAFSEVYAHKPLRATVFKGDLDGVVTSHERRGAHNLKEDDSHQSSAALSRTPTRTQKPDRPVPSVPSTAERSAPSTAPSRSQKQGTEKVGSKRGAVSGSTRMLGDRQADKAIDSWRKIAESPSKPARAWRRLGITLFLFDRPGGMAAFRQIPRLPSKKQAPKPGVPRRTSDRIESLAASDLSVAEEAALWESLYGPEGPKRLEVASLRTKLARLKLGWFEDIAAAQLYDRAGMPEEAERASRQAHSSADFVSSLLSSEVILYLFGVLMLIAYLVVAAIKLLNQAFARPTHYQKQILANSVESCYAPPVPALVPPLPVVQSVQPPPMPQSAVHKQTASPISYRARMIAFVIYFGTYLLITYPLQLLSPLLSRMPIQAALRIHMAIDVVAYVPITVITLMALKRLAEAEQHRRLSWRETLSAIGFRTDGLGKDTVTGVAAYAMTAPIVLLAAYASSMVFRNFHTPVHPVDVIILNTQDGVTRTLLLIQACVGAPIVEEMMFRGLLFEGLRTRWGLASAAILSSAVFALSHNTLPGGFLQLWTLGMIFALVSYRSRSNYPNILMHGIHNGIVMLNMFAVFSQ